MASINAGQLTPERCTVGALPPLSGALDEEDAMVNRRGLVMAAVGSITAVMVFGAGGGVASATPTAPSVVTLDSSNNVYPVSYRHLTLPTIYSE